MGKRHRRQFSAKFKADVVLELLSGRKTQAQLCREHQLSPTLLGTWRTSFLERAERLFEPDQGPSEALGRVAELEQLAGQQALEIAILKKASRLAGGPSTNDGRWF